MYLQNIWPESIHSFEFFSSVFTEVHFLFLFQITFLIEYSSVYIYLLLATVKSVQGFWELLWVI